MTSVCALCGTVIRDAVAAVEHYERRNRYPSKCERRRDRSVADIASERRRRRA